MTTHRRRRHRPPTAALLLGALLATATLACTAADDDATSTAASPAALDDSDAFLAAPDDFDAGETSEPAASDVGALRDTGSAGGGGLDLGSIGRQVIVEMDVTMTSDDVRATVDGVLRSAAALGGGVASSDVDYGERTGQERAVLTVKVPAGSLQSFLGGLDRLGTVTSLGQRAQDVTEQLTDLDVRIANATRSVERVRALLAEAETLGEVIELESELTRRQTDLERLQATERDLTDRVALSTVTLNVYPTAAPPVEDEPVPDDGIADAFRSGLDAFASVLFGIAFVLAVTAPFIAVAAVVALAAWVVIARTRGVREHRETRPTDVDTGPEDREHDLVRQGAGSPGDATPHG